MGGGAPEQPPAEPKTSPERPAWMQRTLRAAVARACPSDLAAHREDLVQAALLRVLERGRARMSRIRSGLRLTSGAWRSASSPTSFVGGGQRS